MLLPIIYFLVAAIWWEVVLPWSAKQDPRISTMPENIYRTFATIVCFLWPIDVAYRLLSGMVYGIAHLVLYYHRRKNKNVAPPAEPEYILDADTSNSSIVTIISTHSDDVCTIKNKTGDTWMVTKNRLTPVKPAQ